MADRSVTRRTRQWAGRNGAIRYRWYERWADLWCAGRDAKVGVTPTAHAVTTPPAALLTPEAAQVWATPRTLALGQLGRARAEREGVRFEAETLDLHVAHRQAGAQAAAARDKAETLAKRLAELGELTAEQADTAMAGEEDADPSVRKGRRHRDHVARRDAVAAQIDQCWAAVERAEVEGARLAELIRVRQDVARVQVAMIEAYVRRRCAAYLARLVRRHPDAERVGLLLRSGWSERPSWIDRPPANEGGG